MHPLPRLALLPLFATAAFAQTVATWNPGSGDWHEETRWSPGVVPDGPGFSAIVDSNAGQARNARITSGNGIELGRLRVGPTDRVVVDSFLRLSNTGFATAGVLNISGTLRLAETSGAVLDFLNDATLTGGGRLELSADQNFADALLLVAQNATLTNENLTISGSGRIFMAPTGLGLVPSYFTNQAAGVIRPETGETLFVSGGRIANTGKFQAASGGTLQLSQNAFEGAGDSLVERLPGGDVLVTNGEFAGETLRNAATGSGSFRLQTVTFDGNQRRVLTQGVLTFDGAGAFDLLTGSIENQGEWRFQRTFAGGGYQGLFLRDLAGTPTTLTGGGKVDFLPEEEYYNYISSDPYTPGMHTLRNVDNTISGRAIFTNVHVRNEEGGRIVADRPGVAMIFEGANTNGVGAVLINAGYLGAENGGRLVVQRELISLGTASSGVSGNGLMTHDGATITGGPLVNGNATFSVIDNRGIELIGDTVLDGRPLAGGALNPVRLTGFFYANGIVLRGATRAADAPATASIQNAGRIRIDGQASLTRVSVFLADDGLGSGSALVNTQPNTDILTLGDSSLTGGGSIGAALQILPGSFVQARGGPLTIEALDATGHSFPVINHARLESAAGGTLRIHGSVIQLPLPFLPLPAIVAFPDSLVSIRGTVAGGTISNQGTNQKGLAAAIEIDGGTLDGVTLVAADNSGFQFHFVADTTSTLKGTITNHTLARVREGSGATRLSIDGPVTLDGTGQLDFAGTGSQIVAAGGNATFTQLAGHTLTGSATINVPFTNHGRVVVPSGQSATFQQPISGSGDYRATNGSITFVQPPSFSGATAGVQASGPSAVIQLPASNALAGAQIISQDQGLLQSTNPPGLAANGAGSGIVAVGGGNIVALGGGNIVAVGGGNIVAVGGGNIIANGGGNIIANGGGNVIANGGGNRPSRSGPDGAPPPLAAAIVAEAGGTIGGAGTFEALNGLHIQAGGFLAPGSSLGTLAVTGDLHVAAAGRVLVEIGGTNPADQHDRVAVSGAATLAGDLVVTLANGFVPSAGQTFTILTAGSVNGAFANVSVPALPGRLTFRASYGAQAVVLTVVQIGTYAEWKTSRFTLEQQADALVSGPTADPDGDGLMNKQEYFFGTEPLAAGSLAKVVPAIGDSAGVRHATLTFPRAQGLSDATFAIERSTDLAATNNWADAPYEIVSTTPGGAGLDLLTVRILPALGSGDVRQFFELRVE